MQFFDTIERKTTAGKSCFFLNMGTLHLVWCKQTHNCAAMPSDDALLLFKSECSSNTAKKVQTTFNLTSAIVLDAD